MKILVLTPWFPAHRHDQAGNYILDSVEAIAGLGHEITVLVTQPWKPVFLKWLGKDCVGKKIQLHKLSLPHNVNLKTCHYLSIPRNYFRSFSNWSYRKFVNTLLEKFIHQHQFEIIHAHTELAGVAAVDVGKKFNIPTVVTLHGINTDPKLYKENTKKILFEYVLGNASRIVLVGEPLVAFFKQFVCKDQHFRVVQNGFRVGNKNLPQIEKIFWPEQTLRFISVANLKEGKGIDLNLYALSKLNEIGFCSWSYKIVGRGPEASNLYALIKELKLENKVELVDGCDHNYVFDHLIKSDVFVLPSYREAFGIAYLEAMSCGLLTVGVKGQGPEMFIEHARTGLLVAPKDVDGLFEAFKSIFLAKDMMSEIARAGKREVHARFTWCKHALKLDAIYHELAAS